MTQQTVRRSVKPSYRIGGEALVMGKASGKDTVESPRRNSGIHAGSLADMMGSGRKISVDARHTSPKRKKAGGWPELPPSKSFTLWVPNEHHEKLSKLAHEKKQSVGALVRQAIAEILKDGHGKPRHGQGAEVSRATAAGPVREVRKGAAAQVPR